jgi:hypothetical protein
MEVIEKLKEIKNLLSKIMFDFYYFKIYFLFLILFNIIINFIFLKCKILNNFKF